MMYKQTVKDLAVKKAEAIPLEWRLAPSLIASVGDLDVISFVNSKCGLSAREVEITNAVSATDLAQKIAAHQYTSLEVTKAFCHRASIVQQLCNALTELFFDEAYARAKYCDEYLATNGKTLGLLHGVPVSLKEEFHLKGTRTTWGFAAWARQPPATNNSAVVELLLNAGAVLYVKTGVPQALMAWESVGVNGRVLNPHNRLLGAGGSSGGEGCLLAARGSLLGIGSDIGGSVRLPASICGIYTLKPTSSRFAYNGSRVLAQGVPLIFSVNGPMSVSIDDVETYCKIQCTGLNGLARKLDPKVVPIPWTPVAITRKLKLGFFTDNGVVAPTPPVTRAVFEAVDALRKAGHEVVPFELTFDGPKLYSSASSIFGGYYDELYDVIYKQSDEGMIPAMRSGDRDPFANGPTPSMKAADIWKHKNVLDSAREAYADTFTAMGIDAVICPTVAIPSCEHDKSTKLTGAVSYTIIWNALDVTAGVIPCSTVTSPKGVDAPKPLNRPYRSSREKHVIEAYNENPMLYQNSKVGLQVVGLKYEEEKIVSVMRIIDSVLKVRVGAAKI
ncbi:glutaminyl-tRNA synthase (glutamine-hydrolysing) [Synchytrium microbalum]|uniref:amidase n=1 Tax=Synchytrium microbalum TaxID=1806994 RepID=A0A507C9S4_9FUNG|nr:glutaminyl-tRNA synthase (glutamine-hydrolysing) [Synchytrium microbalum]TPX34724.1 glutaminyl-tRNA synthase (glutamine-hydrolysing) [Synchytrium microbalum]